MRTTNIRFTGLASGLDTESLVNSMIMPYKNKVDTAKQNQTLMEWKKEAWRDMNAKIFDFYDKFVSNARLENSFNKKSITVSNPNIIELGANSTLPEGSHTIDEVKQLAGSARLDTHAIYTDADKKVKAGKGTKLSELNPPIVPPTGEHRVLKVNDGGEDAYIIVKGDMTLGDLEKELKNNLKNTNVSFDEMAGAFFISSKKTGEGQKLTFEMYNYEHDTALDGELTAEIVKKNKDKLTEDKKDPNILKNIGFSSIDTSTISIKGQNAIVTYNGVEVQSENNNISVNGFNFTVKAKSSEAISVNSSFDTEGVVTYIKEFVGEYNKLIEDIQKQLDMPSTKGYSPLTDEQKKEMSDYEIEQWEKKIKGSLFRKDSDLEKLLGDMRGIFGGVVEGNPFKTFANIGIETGNWKERGKLNLDEDKLRKALAEDAQGVIDLFSKNGENEASTGLADRMYDMMTKQTKSSEMRTAYSFYNDKVLTKNITDKKDEVSKLQKRMYAMEDMYYKRFTAMEKMMSQLNSQSNFLMNQLGGM